MKNLLIGNGINLANDNDYLYTNNINKRLKTILNQKAKMFEAITGIKINMKQLNTIIFKNNPNIEIVADNLYTFVKEQMLISKTNINDNEKYRFIELIGMCCLESIFIIDGVPKYPKISLTYLNKLNTYNKIFTLNYVENWDDSQKCYHLHGNFKEKLEEYKNQGFITNILKHTPDLQTFLNNEEVVIDLRETIFLPDNISKQEYLKAFYFRKNLYPAPDIFLRKEKKLYQELDEVNEIEIFGMSPFGDKDLLKKIQSIENVIIYVYKMDSKEINEWKKYIPHAIFKDSKYFLNL